MNDAMIIPILSVERKPKAESYQSVGKGVPRE